MADIILRDLDDALKEKLRTRAARHGQSMSAELRDIVRDALVKPQAKASEIKRLFAELRKLSAGRPQTPSEVLLRQMRDER